MTSCHMTKTSLKKKQSSFSHFFVVNNGSAPINLEIQPYMSRAKSNEFMYKLQNKQNGKKVFEVR